MWLLFDSFVFGCQVRSVHIVQLLLFAILLWSFEHIVEFKTVFWTHFSIYNETVRMLLQKANKLCSSRKNTYSPHGRFLFCTPLLPGNSSLASYFASKILALKTPLPLGISDDLPWGGYGFCQEMHIGKTTDSVFINETKNII